MPSVRELLLGILVPAILCGSILSLVWGRRETSELSPLRRWNSVVGALAMTVGYCTATLTFLGSIAVPSATRTLAARDWLPWMALAVVATAPLLSPQHVARGLRTASGAALAALLVWLSRGPMLGKPLGGWILALEALLVWIALASTQGLAARNTGLASVLPLFVVALATSIASLFASSALIALLSGALCACLGACAVMAWWNPRFTLTGGPAAVAVVLCSGFWINTVFFSSMPVPAGLCLWMGIIAPWIAEIAIGGERGSWKHVSWSCASAAVPASIAVVWTHLAAPEPYY